MLPDRVSNPGPLTYESGALPIALRGPARVKLLIISTHEIFLVYAEKKVNFLSIFSVKGRNLTFFIVISR